MPVIEIHKNIIIQIFTGLYPKPNHRLIRIFEKSKIKGCYVREICQWKWVNGFSEIKKEIQYYKPQ